MSTTSTQPKVVVTTRVPPELLEQVRRIATREDRSTGPEIRHVLTKYVERTERDEEASA